MARRTWMWVVSLLVVGACGAVCARAEKAVPVRVETTATGWRLLRDGKPYFVKGAGGSASLERLKAAGANSVRTWDAENTDAMLEEAQKLGLTVALGIWLGQDRQGFSYADPKQVAQQEARVRRLVNQYKDNPAVLVWGLGNEMEGDGKNPAVWKEVNRLAGMVKALDPNHPVMTVIAELGDGGDKVHSLMHLCPNIDIAGINSYGGASSVPQRYKAAGGTKPFMLTEFGPPGTWEVEKTSWGAIKEPTSAEKAAWYRRAYKEGCQSSPLCLGSYAFLWGNKREGTATWFGMLLSDGGRLAAVDTMQELWTGKPPANRVPVIQSLNVDSPEAAPGGTVKAHLAASDPENDPLSVTWVLRAEVERYNIGGDQEPELPEYPKAILSEDSGAAEVKLPEKAGAYRLFAYVRDNHGGAAVANVPLLAR